MARREKFQKTNAMRELEAAGVPFEYETYEVDETDTSSELGLHIAQRLGEERLMSRYFIYDLLSPLWALALGVMLLRRDDRVWR